MPQEVMFERESTTEDPGKERYTIGRDLVLTISGQTAMLYRAGTYIRTLDLLDKTARKLFIIDIIEEENAMKSRVAQALNISRQTIDNYLAIKEHLGTEGLIRGDSVSEIKSKPRRRPSGNKAEIVAGLRKQEREQRESENRNLAFSFEGAGKAGQIGGADQIFSQCHDWKKTRYADSFS